MLEGEGLETSIVFLKVAVSLKAVSWFSRQKSHWFDFCQIRQQLVRKYRTPALSMWYCVYYLHTETVIILAVFLFEIFPKC